MRCKWQAIMQFAIISSVAQSSRSAETDNLGNLRIVVTGGGGHLQSESGLGLLVLLYKLYDCNKNYDSKLELHSKLFDQHAHVLKAETAHLEEIRRLNSVLKQHATGDKDTIANSGLTRAEVVQQTRKLLGERNVWIEELKILLEQQRLNGIALKSLENDLTDLTTQINKAAPQLEKFAYVGPANEPYSPHEVQYSYSWNEDEVNRVVRIKADVLLQLLELNYNSSLLEFMTQEQYVSVIMHPAVRAGQLLGFGSLRTLVKDMQVNASVKVNEVGAKNVMGLHSQLVGDINAAQTSIAEKLDLINKRDEAAGDLMTKLVNIKTALYAIVVIAFFKVRFGSYLLFDFHMI